MTKEEIINRLYDRYIRPTEHKKDSFVGVEIEIVEVGGMKALIDTFAKHVGRRAPLLSLAHDAREVIVAADDERVEGHLADVDMTEMSD